MPQVSPETIILDGTYKVASHTLRVPIWVVIGRERWGRVGGPAAQLSYGPGVSDACTCRCS